MAAALLKRGLPSTLGAAGALLGLVTLAETAIRVGGQYPANVPFVAGLVTSVPFMCLLLVGAVRLRRGVVTVERFPRIAGWTVAGTVFFGAFFSLVAMFFFSSLWDRVGVLRWGLAVGAGGGLLVGYTNARSIDRAIAAERSAIRAEEAAERRELLTYLHALLRHEVLNSVTAIEGHATLLESSLDDDSESERIDVIQRQCQGLSRVIEKVQFLLDATDEPENSQSVDLVPVLETELANLHDRFDDVDVESDTPETLVADADGLVRHLFENLLQNAVEHNDDGTPHVSLTASRREDTVTVTITDDGPGLPETVRENPLDPSVDMRADHGLGLAIVYRLVDRYDGHVDIETPDTGGTRVQVRLPRGEASAATPPDERAESSDRTATESPARSTPDLPGSQSPETNG